MDVSASEIDQRAARLADPGVDLQAKHSIAQELRELVDTVHESARVFSQLVPAIIDMLRSGEPAFRKDSLEYQFRRVLLDIIHRCPPHAQVQTIPIYSGLLHILRHDNEEMGVTCCKTMVDLARTHRTFPEEVMSEFMTIIQELLESMPGLVQEFLSEHSSPMDSNVLLPSIRSFRVAAEAGHVLTTFSSSPQLGRQLVAPAIVNSLPVHFPVLALQVPQQQAARENYEAMGGIWAGMAPDIVNRQAYADLIQTQIKVLSYTAFALRVAPEMYEPHGNTMVLAGLRLLQDCPDNNIALRKDLAMVCRHLFATPYRKVLIPHVDKVLDERVLFGNSISCRETLKGHVYAGMGDLIHQIRGDMTPAQLTHAVFIYARLLQDPALPNSLHIIFCKVLFNSVEPIATNDTPQNATRLLTFMFEVVVDKLESLTFLQGHVAERAERMKKGDKQPTPIAAIEEARNVSRASWAIQKPEDFATESRTLFRALIHALRVLLQAMKKCDAPVPDGTLVFRIFEASIRATSFFDGPQETRDYNDALESFSGFLTEVNLHIFQEVWTHKIEFFFDYARKRPALCQICVFLVQKEPFSPALTSIILRFLVDRLPLLGNEEKDAALVTIRMYKLAFQAISAFPALNEPILAAHLGKLIMDCFPLAAKSTNPTHYFLLLRSLFRAIAQGGGKFEQLYKEVLPLLPDMLECLNRHLHASEGEARDMIVELCLTVPLRLTHLLPHLTYLMQPLAMALRGASGSELVTQGLRTLELCIDNLTPDFLDPTLNTVLRELMEALHAHLKPLPAHHVQSHTTVRILGKLGGRNRKLMYQPPSLTYHERTGSAMIPLSFGGIIKKVALTPVSLLTSREIVKPSAHRDYAYDYAKNCLVYLLKEENPDRDCQEVFSQSLQSLFDAISWPERREEASELLRRLSQQIFGSEMRRIDPIVPGGKRYTSWSFASYLDAMTHALAREDADQAQQARELVSAIVHDLIAMRDKGDFSSQDVVYVLHQIAIRFSGLCYDDFWFRKSAGCNGIKMLTCTPDLGVQWINEREVDLVRTLLHVLKDLPSDLPRDVDDVIDILTRVLRVSRGDAMSSEGMIMERQKISHLVGILFAELSSPNPVVRKAAQAGIQLIAEKTGRSATDHMMPYRERMLNTIFNKPLRALPFNIQIGMLEAVRFCVCLTPPLLEVTDELLRLIHEALALADAEDANLIGQRSDRQRSMDLVKLRVSCITLLTASMPMMDFYAKHPQTRQRVTSVYFKSLYAPHAEVKEVAHEGLQLVLAHQSRLPKELLQTGLRPILTNLADPKRLSVSGLEGLARLLELLTNYFKVEIGHKLLDHFRFVADPQMLQASSRLPLADNDSIMKLVRLANIFHLLPSAANIFLENLVNAIVQTEAHLHFSSRSPFSEPLAKYLDRYPTEAMSFFMLHLQFPRHVRTLRSILQARLAIRLQRELSSRTPTIIEKCLQGNDGNLLTPGLLLFSDLIELSPTWINDNGYVVDVLLDIWRSEVISGGPPSPDVTERHALIMRIFMKALDQTPRIDLFFDLISVYSANLPIDTVHLTDFLYRRVALNGDLAYRRNILYRFLPWFEDPSYSLSDKGYFIRLVITPMLSVHASASPNHGGLLDRHIITWMLKHIWAPMIDNSTFTTAEDTFKVEVLQLTTVMVQHYPDQLESIKAAIIKCAWHYITNGDALVTQTAYLLAARFFEVYDSPEKFILRAWTGLLKPPHAEGTMRLLRQSLEILTPVLPRCNLGEHGVPNWAKATRRLLAEEGAGLSQLLLIYQLVVRHPDLFYPVRTLFVPHMVSSLPKLGYSPLASHESRLLSLELLQVLFDWERKATDTDVDMDSVDPDGADDWKMPLALRENMVSYLVRLATNYYEAPVRAVLLPRALSLLRLMLGHSGLNDVSVKLHFFSRHLEQSDLTTDTALQQAVGAAKVLQIVAAEKPQEWFEENIAILQKLVRKGMMTDESALHDSLLPIFDRLIQAYPLPKEDEEQDSDAAELHSWVHSSIGESLGKAVGLRGMLLMLKTIVSAIPERIESFLNPLVRLGSKLVKDHISAAPTVAGYEHAVRMLITIFRVCDIGVAFLGEQRRWFISSLQIMVEKSKSPIMCVYILDTARDWALHKRDPYPTMKDKAQILRAMVAYEARGDTLFNNYLELIFDIYAEPSLRRSELTTRLEPAFILGCRAKDARLRERFMVLLDSSIPRSLFNRLTYVLGVQSWDSVASHHWIHIALYLVLSAADSEAPLLPQSGPSSYGDRAMLGTQQAGSIIEPMRNLCYVDSQTAHEMWVSVFPAAWSCLSRREQADITHHMITLLSRDYHIKQAELRPNVIQTLLTGIHACTPPVLLPPHLVKYLAKTFGAWHVALEILEASLEHLRDEEISIRDTIYDALAEVYAELAEDDLYYGLWRHRSLHVETNNAIAFEQHGMWDQACYAYEVAQSRSRSGAIAFSEPEYCLWEDHWMLANEKLQHWDLLHELGRNEGNHELVLEAAWRTKDWGQHREALEEQISMLPEVATPRRRVFEAFIALLKAPSAVEKNVDFTRILEDAMQLSLRKWVGLPFHLSAAHVPLLQHFQQFVELQEAVQIFGSLSGTTAQNLEKKSQDLKMVLQAWRERLPNIEDDISIWSDLIAWRQRVFDAINKAYIPLIGGGSQGGNASSGSSDTFGYRGYHETAWIINRFAHVARKHDLLEVCFTYLNKIYTLPNIEISEAFLKLREQARCHYQKPNDLHAGLEVINNTNLLYFSPAQKAEFFTLKGMFQARFGNNEEANAAFAQAAQLDMTQAKAWAEWGKYHDRIFKENPTDLGRAAQAVSCYLQAAGIFKNGKSRPLLARILWLLSVDDTNLHISRQFDQYKGDGAWWYWITLIPQLCLSMSQREVSQARYVLLNLAKLFPQALFYQLRTTREEMALMKKRLAAAQAMDPSSHVTPDHPMQDATGISGPDGMHAPDHASPSRAGVENAAGGANGTFTTRQPWDVVDEVVKILKTAFPLLILCLESMVEQIGQRFKGPREEDGYRLICMLMHDGIQNLCQVTNTPEDDGQLPVNTVRNLTQMAMHFEGPMKAEYEEDFLTSKPGVAEYLQRLQKWRDRYEAYLDARPRVQSLDTLSHYLTEFQYGKYDEIEVPGQYLHECDNNQNFVRIQKFDPKFENCRTAGSCWRRLTIHGHDNSRTTFAVQLHTHRAARREERGMQVFRTFNGHLERRREARRRALQFHLPIVVPCSPSLRLFQNDSSYITLGDIYDQYCKERGFDREEPIIMICNKVKTVLREFQAANGRRPQKAEYFSLKKDLFDEVRARLVPDDIILKHMMRAMNGPQELWRMRKQFTLELAACSFMTYIFCLMGRLPGRFHVSMATGRMSMTDISPSIANNQPVFATTDTVPFRLTPNLQRFLGTFFTEGTLNASIIALACCLTAPQYDMDFALCLLARDEVTAWYTSRDPHLNKSVTYDAGFKNSVQANIDTVVKRVETMACKLEREQAAQQPNASAGHPVCQTVTNLISSATNPINLVKMMEPYHYWF